MVERLTWHENGGGNFTAHEIYEIESTGGFAEIVSTIADLDADGDADIAAADCASGRVLWFENDGSSPPSFGLHVIDDSFAGTEMASADFDQDGDTDLMTGMNLGRLRVYENTGGSPPGFAVHELTDTYQGPLLGDLNGDGRIDIALFSGSILVGGFRWFENLGAFKFALHETGAIEQSVFFGGVLADLEEDGDLDLLAATRSVGGQTVRVEATRTVGAWIEGIASDGVQCRNLSTGQSVLDVSLPGNIFDCQALGLTVNPGDTVEITVRGISE